MFSIQNTEPVREELEDINISPLVSELNTAKFDLTMNVIEDPEGLRCLLEYNTDLFKDATISRMLAHWQILLEGIVRDPEQSLAQLPFLSTMERQQLLVEWNAPQMTTSDANSHVSLHTLFELQAEQTPQAIALVYEDQHITYQALNAHTNHLAHYLQKQGIVPEVPVGICMERSLEMIICLLGILKSGGVYLPLIQLILKNVWPL